MRSCLLTSDLAIMVLPFLAGKLWASGALSIYNDGVPEVGYFLHTRQKRRDQQ
jgi:hypothetical protein